MTPTQTVEPKPDLLYAEDLSVGSEIDLGTHTPTAQEIDEFATMWDPLPFHVDAEAAARSRFGGIIASGLHVMAIYSKLQAEGLFQRTAIVAGRGSRDMRLLLPVRAGDTLRGGVTPTSLRLRDDGHAVVVFHAALWDTADRKVFEMACDVLVASRPSGSAD